MAIRAISIDDKDEWNEIVKSFPNYDVYYLWQYVVAFQLHGDGIPWLIYFENGKNRAINVVMKRDIAEVEYFSGEVEKNKYFDFSTPYGYGGFIFEGKDTSVLDEEYNQFCKKNNIVCEFVRFHPILNNVKNLENMYLVLDCGNTVCIDLQCDILSNCSKENRNRIRKAKQEGLEVYWSRDEKLIDEFIEIYESTMDRDHASNYYYFKRDFYESILKDLKYNAMFFYTVLKGEIIAVTIIMMCNKMMHYHLSASRGEYRNLAPSNLLLYEVASFGKEHGFEKFHLGGGVGAQRDNLYKFKKKFYKGEDLNFFVGKKIFDESSYQMLVDLRYKATSKKIRDGYFPVYRG